jgi:hypothetical protein
MRESEMLDILVFSAICCLTLSLVSASAPKEVLERKRIRGITRRR